MLLTMHFLYDMLLEHPVLNQMLHSFKWAEQTYCLFVLFRKVLNNFVVLLFSSSKSTFLMVNPFEYPALKCFRHIFKCVGKE